MNTNVNVEIMQSEMITKGVLNLIKRAQKEVLEVCAKEYNFDINAAMLLVNAGAERKDKPRIAKDKVVKERKAVKEKKERAKKAVKELVEGEVEGDRKRNCLEGDRKGSRGRPKNPEKVVEVEETENLFEQLVNTRLEQVEYNVECRVLFQTKEEKKKEEVGEKLERVLMSGEEKDTKVANKLEEKATASANAKLAKLEAKEADKLAKEAEKATAIANAKLAKLEATASAIAAKEQEKLAKEADKVAKEQAKEQEKLAKEQEKLAKEQAKEAEKLAKEQAKKSTTNASAYKGKKFSSTASSGIASNKTKETAERIAKEANDVEYQAKMTELSEKLEAAPGNKLAIPVASVAVVVAEAPATLKVKSFKYEGATYFREKNTGAIYDKETNDHLGQWNEATQKIDFLEVEEELEEEEESAGESSDEEEEEDA